MSETKVYVVPSGSVLTGNPELHDELKTKLICRFCLSQQKNKLGSIYTRDYRFKSSAPLPVQVLAIASIKVAVGDGLPSYICFECRILFEHSFRFKQMCKRAESLLRQYPVSGKMAPVLPKPKYPHELLSARDSTDSPIKAPQSQTQKKLMTQQDDCHPSSTPSQTNTQPQAVVTIGCDENIYEVLSVPIIMQGPKKILNSNPVESPEPPAPKRIKRLLVKKEPNDILTKFENDEEISIEDFKEFISATEDEEDTPPKKKPKILNKSSPRILNKDLIVSEEPRWSLPQVKHYEDGNVAIVTEILDPLAPYETEPDPVKDVATIETNVFPCSLCDRTFPLVQLRDIHMVNHNRERNFKCNDCDKSFFSKYDLQKHSLIHTGDKPFKCPVCSKSFTRASLLHRHEKSHTDIPKYLCVHCEKPFLSKEEMEKHTERHLKNRPYKCKLCSKSFAFKQGLDRHEVVHSRDQPFPCQYCSQSFSTASKLARHLTAHAGKRPYPCKFCSKSYLLSHHLTRHMRSHTQGKASFQCFLCKKVCGSRDDLIVHCGEHANDTLICPLCKDLFRTSKEVAEHISKHREGETFACEFCDLIFITSAQLQKHIDADHVADMEAYHEDELTKPEKSVNNKVAKIDSANFTENVDDIQQSINEILTEEIPEIEDIIITEDEEEEEEIKEEDSKKSPKITKNNTKEQVIKIEDNNKSSGPQVRRVITMSGKLVECIDKPSVGKELSPPILRRKTLPVTRASTAASLSKKNANDKSKNKVIVLDNKVLKEEPGKYSNTINSVLRSLPRSVSIRRNPSAVSSTAKKAPTTNAAGKSSASPDKPNSKKTVLSKQVTQRRSVASKK